MVDEPAQIRAHAERILLSQDLAEKLRPIEGRLVDDQPGEALRVREPGRPAELTFAERHAAPSMPAFGAFKDPAKRAVAHHIMANHELQALEVMAFVLCAFPDAPREFRRGMIEVMKDEQRHTTMHIARAEKLGLRFGELGVNCYIWKKALEFNSPLEYVAGLPLVFENANLDHSLEFAEAFERAGDARSAALMRVIHNDEIEHVRFGLEWLRMLKPEGMSDYDAYRQNLHWPLRPQKARGNVFQREARLEAGMSDEFVDQLEIAGE